MAKKKSGPAKGTKPKRAWIYVGNVGAGLGALAIAFPGTFRLVMDRNLSGALDQFVLEVTTLADGQHTYWDVLYGVAFYLIARKILGAVRQQSGGMPIVQGFVHI